eukprot:gene5106-10219_t
MIQIRKSNFLSLVVLCFEFSAMLAKPLAKNENYMIPFYNCTEKVHRDCYPEFQPLSQILQKWSPDDVNISASYSDTLRIFDFSMPSERSIAKLYRDAELPFKVFNTIYLNKAVLKWTDDYILKHAKGKGFAVEKSKSNHFLFWNTNFKNSTLYPNFIPPTEFSQMSIEEWLKTAKDSELTTKIINKKKDYYYLHINTDFGSPRKSHFISRDLALFSPNKGNFFVTNPNYNDGIECRFGMRGIVAEAHADSSRNMVANIRGKRRVILAPPKSCNFLGIVSNTNDPFYRQSSIDWTNMKAIHKNNFHKVDAIETILHPGEILFIPSFWFHYIVSLETTIQCNAHSPYSNIGKAEIEKCYKL